MASSPTSGAGARTGRPRRWLGERAHSWLDRYRRILVRWEKLARTYDAMLHIVCAVTVWETVCLLE
jgi:transposase